MWVNDSPFWVDGITASSSYSPTNKHTGVLEPSTRLNITGIDGDVLAWCVYSVSAHIYGTALAITEIYREIQGMAAAPREHASSLKSDMHTHTHSILYPYILFGANKTHLTLIA